VLAWRLMVAPEPSNREEFVRQAGLARGGTLRDVWGFLRENKKWWLLPIIVSLAAVGALIVLAGSAAAPFIYTLF
jgi:hypothetical protein